MCSTIPCGRLSYETDVQTCNHRLIRGTGVTRCQVPGKQSKESSEGILHDGVNVNDTKVHHSKIALRIETLVSQYLEFLRSN